MKSFKEAQKDVKEGIKKNKNGNPIRTFSRSDINRLVNAYLNDPKHVNEVCSVRGGKVEKTQTTPSKTFREKMLVPMLVDFGIDKQEAQRVVDTYHFRQSQTDNLYEMIEDVIYQYMLTGKKFNFQQREDFVGSLKLKDVESSVVVDKKGRKVKRGAHKTIVKKSGCPSWQKFLMN